ncbi:uncharacterized protein Dyak_GE21799 [Drosophila yakuba]|uniref:Ig-like domain-containing protein n=2 Tax=Drosophila yakuba TaxID=7245 RepID=B4PF20_DROYA|nr:uncharacterized protein Dyak_GE21799 [Drosophila yakuba]
MESDVAPPKVPNPQLDSLNSIKTLTLERSGWRSVPFGCGKRSLKTTFTAGDRNHGSTIMPRGICNLNRIVLLCLCFLICGDLIYIAAQRSTAGKTERRNYTGKKPVVIQHRSQDAVNYYDHENGAKIIKSSHFELDYTLGRKITFFCMAQGNPRPTITWFKDGAELYQHRFFQVHESHIEANIVKSKMEIDPTTQMDAGFYECQADNIYAIDRRGFRTDYVMVNF